jgi:hypothetical protein
LFLTRLIEGVFPDYQAALPSDPPARTVVESDQLWGALGALGKELFGNDDCHLTRLRLDADVQILAVSRKGPLIREDESSPLMSENTEQKLSKE